MGSQDLVEISPNWTACNEYRSGEIYVLQSPFCFNGKSKSLDKIQGHCYFL